MFHWFGKVSFVPYSKVQDFAVHLKDGRLMGTVCKGCGYASFPPRADCPDCMSGEFEFKEWSGKGSGAGPRPRDGAAPPARRGRGRPGKASWPAPSPGGQDGEEEGREGRQGGPQRSVSLRQRQEIQKVLRSLKPIKTKLSCDPLQAMIQMIIIVASNDSEHTVETL